MYDTLTRIAELRLNKNWSVYRLAKESNIPQTTISTWYAKNLCPPIDKIEKICQSLGISLAEFFSNDVTAENHNQVSDLNQKWVLLNPNERTAVMSVINAFVDRNHTSE